MTKEMTPTKAAQIWEEEKREVEARTARLNAAADILKGWFRRTGKQTFRGRISYSMGSRLMLNTPKVKTELGDRLPDFQRRVSFETLTLVAD